MRATAVRVRQLGGPPPLSEDLDILVRTMKGHIHLLATEIRVQASRLPAEAGPARCALAGAAEAERRLRAALPRLFDTPEARYTRALKVRAVDRVALRAPREPHAPAGHLDHRTRSRTPPGCTPSSAPAPSWPDSDRGGNGLTEPGARRRAGRPRVGHAPRSIT
ncbi:DUF6415 family natural product biosynthesis protein [Streptomyces exfoliatus]|uniref:DUF6415 family natural product biosynthesis protein n=1 Tax=Streptomyces exfoliatus TaxID=1905 RepID=UPI003D66C9AF